MIKARWNVISIGHVCRTQDEEVTVTGGASLGCQLKTIMASEPTCLSASQLCRSSTTPSVLVNVTDAIGQFMRCTACCKIGKHHGPTAGVVLAATCATSPPRSSAGRANRWMHSHCAAGRLDLTSERQKRLLMLSSTSPDFTKSGAAGAARSSLPAAAALPVASPPGSTTAIRTVRSVTAILMALTTWFISGQSSVHPCIDFEVPNHFSIGFNHRECADAESSRVAPDSLEATEK
mmetsp:Transcript_59543/g.109561  ORF Transcript_59543/g.109561 Transcript_59543/m.109561 type:complete len:235 (-) Transcript_59543:31-735(-)